MGLVRGIGNESLDGRVDLLGWEGLRECAEMGDGLGGGEIVWICPRIGGECQWFPQPTSLGLMLPGTVAMVMFPTHSSPSGMGRCRHFIIRQMDNGRYMILGDDRLHNSVTDLLDYHRTVPILPFAEYLTKPCYKLPERHYEEIGRNLDLSSSPQGPGGGSGDIPSSMEYDDPDGEAIATPEESPVAVGGAKSPLLDRWTRKERPERHYEEIDGILSRTRSARSPGGRSSDAPVPQEESDPEQESGANPERVLRAESPPVERWTLREVRGVSSDMRWGECSRPTEGNGTGLDHHIPSGWC
ncbi:uncharacterized protein [Hemitrygon akajei]|uniref:uncharacterized protein n=1 Tax=Hemitrygon akajei TaxID=2704970 RepID=UPI003BF9EED2